MGVQNVATRNYMSRNGIFTEVFNAASGGRDKMKELLDRHKKIYENLDSATAELLKVCAHMDIYINENEEVVNMCKAWDDMARESMERGMVMGGLAKKRHFLANVYRVAYNILEG